MAKPVIRPWYSWSRSLPNPSLRSGGAGGTIRQRHDPAKEQKAAQPRGRPAPDGTLDTPEFQRQSRDFAAALKAAGKPVELRVGDGYNHFEMIETLANPYGVLGRAALEQMRLTPA